MVEREKRSIPIVPLLAVLVALGYVFSHLYQILIPFILSFSLAYVLSPLITLFQSRGVRREVTVVALYGLVVLIAWMATATFLDVVAAQFHDLQAEAPSYFARVKNFALDLELAVNARLPFGLKVPHKLNVNYADVLAKLRSLPGYLLSLVPALSLILLVPFITFFLLIDAQDGIENMIQACPSRYVEQALHLLSEIDTSLGAYLRGLLVVAVAIFTMAFVGLLVLGVDQALMIAFLSGATSFIPYVGAVIGAIVGSLVAMFQYGEAAAAVKVLILFGGIRFVDELVLGPIVAKHSVHLHPLVFLICFMIGGDLFGFMGLVFAVPVACIIKALFKVGWDWYTSEAQMKTYTAFDAAAIPYT